MSKARWTGLERDVRRTADTAEARTYLRREKVE